MYRGSTRSSSRNRPTSWTCLRRRQDGGSDGRAIGHETGRAPWPWRDRARCRRCRAARRRRRRRRAPARRRSRTEGVIVWPCAHDRVGAGGEDTPRDLGERLRVPRRRAPPRRTRPRRGGAASCPGSRATRMRVATPRIRASPTPWPSVSLTSLSLSMSISKQSRRLGARILRGAADELDEALAVPQPGELVDIGERPQRLFLPAAPADVLHEPDHRPPLRIGG